MTKKSVLGYDAQQQRNRDLIEHSQYMRSRVESKVLPFSIDIVSTESLDRSRVLTLKAIETEAARVALRTLASLAKINELDHLGGALDLIPAFTLTRAVTDHKKVHYTFEHAHTSVGHYAVLTVWGYLDEHIVIDKFRRSLDIAGHTAWVPGGTELNGGRLGVMIPAAVGQALGVRAREGDGSWLLCHTGDAGWISGQALNGFNGADLHGAPITFVMHRNGIQLSDTNRRVMDKDPRPIVEAMGVEILEIPSLLDPEQLFTAYRTAWQRAQEGRPSMIYPTGYRTDDTRRVDLRLFGEMYGILTEVKLFAKEHNVPLDTEIWIPGSLMSYRDVFPMIECLFHVNGLTGGKGHHDGHIKGRDLDVVLSNPMFREPNEQADELKQLRGANPVPVVTEARPEPGTANLVLPEEVVRDIELPPAGKSISARAGVEAGYAAVARTFPDDVFVVSCDLDPSTKLEKARTFLAPDHQFEMSIEEQVSTLMANGLAVSSRRPQLNVFSTFAAFFDGIAREGMEMWRYQRNLNGVNEGLNVTFHMSHVGACTGRDHFSGWSLDWITMALGYLPYLHRFYAPADARAAFIAVKDLAAHYGGHIIGVPRDNLPVLSKQDGSGPLWEAGMPWEPVTAYRQYEGAKKAILVVGAPAFLAGEAAEELAASGEPADVYVVNGFPLPDDAIGPLLKKYDGGMVTVEDSLIGTPKEGVRGFAGVIRSLLFGSGTPVQHVGIVDPRIAPSDGFMETWEHFGITKDAIREAIRTL